MRIAALLLPILLLAGGANAHTLSLAVTNNSTCGTGNGNHSPGTLANYPNGSTCFEASGLNDTNVAVLNDTGSDSDVGGGVVSLTNTFAFDAAVAVDAFIGNNEYQELNVSYDLTFTIDTDDPADTWTLSLDHDAMGLLGLHGDGTLSAVGTQDDGHAHISALNLTGDVSTSLLANQPFNDNPSNNGQNSQTFSDSGTGIAVASGTGDATVQVTIDFKLDAFSNDGCSGFICSSASGGEEAAVLFGVDDASGLGDVDADEYSEWGRAVGPDGYNSTWTLDVTGAVCGNGAIEGSEECDDGNTTPEDGCSDTCLNEFCGDDVVQAGLGETCDDGNTVSGDGCDEFCQAEPPVFVPSAGDGVLMLLAASLLVVGAFLLTRTSRRQSV